MIQLLLTERSHHLVKQTEANDPRWSDHLVDKHWASVGLLLLLVSSADQQELRSVYCGAVKVDIFKETWATNYMKFGFWLLAFEETDIFPRRWWRPKSELKQRKYRTETRLNYSPQLSSIAVKNNRCIQGCWNFTFLLVHLSFAHPYPVLVFC